MAMTYPRAVEIAREVRDVSDATRALLKRVEQVLEVNSAAAIDWGNAQKPEVLIESVDGNLDGLLFSRQDLSNAIFSLLQIKNALKNQAVTQGDHLGNLLKLATVRPQ